MLNLANHHQHRRHYLIYCLLILVIIPMPTLQSNIVFPLKDPNNITISIGSCNKYYGYENSDIFYTIADMNPDIYVWLGDVAYIDNKKIFENYTEGIEIVKQRFMYNKNDPPYQYFLSKVKHIIGTWDDHDYGYNDGDKTFIYKDQIQQLWLDFMNEPLDSIRRTRKGVYESYYLGNENLIKFILLDTRYFKDKRPPFKGFWWDGERDMLGEEQWKWLEEELINNKAKYVLIGSGIQFMTDDRFVTESWFKQSKSRLMNLIKKHRINGVIIMSGDVHWGEIMAYPCYKRDLGYQLYEITSSGLSHNLARNYLQMASVIGQKFWPKTYHGERGIYLDKNFGTIRVIEDEPNNRSMLYLEIRAKNGTVVQQKKIDYNDLIYQDYPENELPECSLDTPPFLRLLHNFILRLARFEWRMWLVLGFVNVIIFTAMVIWSIACGLFQLALVKLTNKKKVE